MPCRGAARNRGQRQRKQSISVLWASVVSSLKAGWTPFLGLPGKANKGCKAVNSGICHACQRSWQPPGTLPGLKVFKCNNNKGRGGTGSQEIPTLQADESRDQGPGCMWDIEAGGWGAGTLLRGEKGESLPHRSQNQLGKQQSVRRDSEILILGLEWSYSLPTRRPGNSAWSGPVKGEKGADFRTEAACHSSEQWCVCV